MPRFVFSGRTPAGERISGERVADSMALAVAGLRREQVLVTRIGPVADAPATLAVFRRRGPRVRPRSLASFTRELAVMVDAGLPLLQCLEILGTQEEDAHFSRAILATRADVEAGASLADAMRKHPGVFDQLFTHMIAAGEAAGVLDTILERLAAYVEKDVKLRRQVKSALAYPVTVIGIAVAVVALILWKVVPTFASLFEGLGAELPLPTRVVIRASESLTASLPLTIAGIAAGVIGFRWYRETPGGRRAIDRMALALPVLGGLLRKVAISRFSRTLSTLLSSGVPILDALGITARTAGNAVVEQAILATRTSVERGATLAGPLKGTAVFPAMVVQMLGVGEATGALDTMLSKVAEFYEEEVDTAVAGLLALLEPVLITLLGVIVGGIVVAMYLPIFEVVGKATR